MRCVLAQGQLSNRRPGGTHISPTARPLSASNSVATPAARSCDPVWALPESQPLPDPSSFDAAPAQPKKLACRCGKYGAATPDASLDSALRHRPKPKADTSLLPASGCNTRKYGGLDYQVRNNLRSTDGRTSCTEARAAQRRYLSTIHLCYRIAATSQTATRYRRLHPVHPASRNLDSFNLTPSCALPLSPALALSLLALLFFSLSGLAEKNEKEKKLLEHRLPGHQELSRRSCFVLVSRITGSVVPVAVPVAVPVPLVFPVSSPQVQGRSSSSRRDATRQSLGETDGSPQFPLPRQQVLKCMRLHGRAQLETWISSSQRAPDLSGGLGGPLSASRPCVSSCKQIHWLGPVTTTASIAPQPLRRPKRLHLLIIPPSRRWTARPSPPVS